MIRIESKGTAIGTRVTIAETGEQLPMVNRVELVIDAETGDCFAIIRTVRPELLIDAGAKLDNWPPPEWLRKIFMTWAKLTGLDQKSERSLSLAEHQYYHNIREFARCGLKRIN